MTLFKLCLENKNITGVTMYVNSFNGEPAVSYNDSSFDYDIFDCMNDQDVGYHVLYSGGNPELPDEYQNANNEIMQWSSQINKNIVDDNVEEVTRLSKRALEHIIDIRTGTRVADAAAITVIKRSGYRVLYLNFKALSKFS